MYFKPIFLLFHLYFFCTKLLIEKSLLFDLFLKKFKVELLTTLKFIKIEDISPKYLLGNLEPHCTLIG